MLDLSTCKLRATALHSQSLFLAMLLLSARPGSVFRILIWNAFPHIFCDDLITKKTKHLFVL